MNKTIKVNNSFFDHTEGVMRKSGDTFEISSERFKELSEALPDYIEEVAAHDRKQINKKA